MNASTLCALGRHLADALPLAAKAAERPHEWLAINQAAAQAIRLLGNIEHDIALLPIYRTDAAQSHRFLVITLRQSGDEILRLDPANENVRRLLAEQDAKFPATPSWALDPAANSHLLTRP
jgi:hypothetical protein